MNLTLNFYFDKDVLLYLDSIEQDKVSKSVSKSGSKSAVSEIEILELCKIEKSLKEITEYFGFKDVYKFKRHYINKLLNERKLEMTIPDKPNSRMQKYKANLDFK